MSASVDIDHLRQWVGRTDENSDVISTQLVKGLRATLFMDIGKPEPGDVAPLTTHWCLAQPVAAMNALGEDGHPARGGFLPPVPLPRRMWAGGQLEFLDPLRAGDAVTRTSRIGDVVVKTGGSGLLFFVTVEHVLTTSRGIAIRERQDIVYRDVAPQGEAKNPAAPASGPTAQHSQRHMADPVLLFRYSALTFNGHRIHYDRSYATTVEGYPGLVVHGPLQAALLAQFAATVRQSVPKKFTYRGVRPLFDGAEFSVNANPDGAGLSVWTANSDGTPTMQATAVW